jgi:hypothetical protein
MKVFTEGILGEPPEPTSMEDLEAHGVTGVFSALNTVFRGLHFRSDAEGLVVVVDCDNEELHRPAHDEPGGAVETCRLCRARRMIAQAQNQLRPIPGRSKLKVAIGLAVPAIEAWLLVGKDPQVGEAAWLAGLTSGKPPFNPEQLKKLVYVKDRPSRELQIECAEREARRIIQNLQAIENAFPAGFGSMSREIRSWIEVG